ncbi:MAG: NAD(P)-dependent oxidoreductase [Desulfurococcaceae archaeon]
MDRVLVTGATGFVGFNLVRYLINQQVKVFALVRPTSKVDELVKNGVEIIKFNENIDILIDSLKSIKPDVVFHIASLFITEHHPHQVSDLINSNILFPTILVEALVNAEIQNFVNIGTIWQHYRHDSREYLPVNLYSATKQAFMDILKYYSDAYKLKVITLKLSDTYGPNDNRKKLLNLLKDSHLYGNELALSPGEQMIDLVYISDVVRAIYLAGKRLLELEDIVYEEYSVDTKKPIKVRDLVKLYEEIAGTKLNVKIGAKPYRKREVFIPWNMGKWLPGWEPQISLRQGLKKFIESYTKQEGDVVNGL